MAELTGLNRARLMIEWIKRDRPTGDFETFLKQVCKAKKIDYTEPTKLKRKDGERL